MNPAPVRSIPFFDYPHLFLSEEQELTAIFRDVGRTGRVHPARGPGRGSSGTWRPTSASNTRWEWRNATDGLLLALRAAGIGPGDEVIFCSHTMVATAAAIHFAGATPVPVECGDDHLIDPEAVEKAVTPRTRAILPTQLNGRTADMQALTAIAKRHDLAIVEDAAQALGSRFQGRAAGSFGVAARVQFLPGQDAGVPGRRRGRRDQPRRRLPTRVELRDHGRGADGEIVSWGLNSRLDNLQAAILDFRLASYDDRRRAAAGAGRSLQGPPAGHPPGAAAAGARTTIRTTSTFFRTTRSKRSGATRSALF